MNEAPRRIPGGREMTKAQAAWLRKLLDEGPQSGKTDHVSAIVSLQEGWSVPDEAGWPWHKITPAGIAALAEHEERTK